jgi:adenosylcobinamide-GDP ribazoletransferase
MNCIKRFFKGLYMSFGLFTAIPLPSHVWDETCTNFILIFFPFIGAVIGVLWWGAAKLVISGGIPIMLASAVTAIFPFFAAGFLHLDGFMDTSDAVLSRRPLEEKRRILKDPHIGAFAVIMLAVLFVLQFAVVFIIIEKGQHLVLLITIPIISRSCAALSILCLNTMPQSSYANMLRQNTGIQHKIVVIITAILAIAFSGYFARTAGLITTASTAVGFIAALVWAYKDLHGVSGDVAGFALVIGELCGLIAMAVMRY